LMNLTPAVAILTHENAAASSRILTANLAMPVTLKMSGEESRKRLRHVADVDSGFYGGNGLDLFTLLLRILLGILCVSVILLCGIMLFDRATPTSPRETADASSQVRQWARSLQVLSGDEVQEKFKARGGYDCLHHQPQFVASAVRLEGRVIALPQSMLKAPLARCNCVLFSTSAATVRLDGVRAPPAAFCAMNSDFDIDLPTASGSIRVRVRGVDVALFDIASGWQRERTSLEDAPEHLQDFLHAHRAPGTGTLDSSEVLDFTECRLDAGAFVTCVGELHREATGELILQPYQNIDSIPDSDNCAPDNVAQRSAGALLGLTSWEAQTLPRSPRASPRTGKVMISDDPALRDHSAPSLFSSSARKMRNFIARIRPIST
jgi:hypothetical protein